MPYTVIIGLPRWHATGPAIFAERLVRELVALGHDARILLTEAGFNRVAEERAVGEVPADLPCDRLPSGPDDTWGQRWEALERYLEERGPCFYLMLHDWRNNIVARRLSNRVRLIGLCQADSVLEVDQVMRLGDQWNAIVAVSDPIHFKLASLRPHLAERMLTIRNAVPALDVAPTKAAGGPLLIAYSGELRPHQKRLDDMVDVACRLADRGVDFRLTFFGDGAHRAHLEHRTQSLIARGLVSFAGHRGGEDLLAELAAQHVFLLTSEFEGLSIAMLEAMSRGCVPVVSRLASQSLVVREGVNGLAADVGDIAAFAGHLEGLAKDRTLLARMASRAFATIAEDGYRVQDMLANYLALFDRLDQSSDRRGFLRWRGPVTEPPQAVAGVSILPGNHIHEFEYMSLAVPWPDPPRGVGAHRATTTSACPLEGHRVIVAAKAGEISGVDVFAGHLVRGLRERGIDARLHTRLPPGGVDAAGLPSDLPFDERDPAIDADYLGWLGKWRHMVEHLERLAPCIYVPNYDSDFSCVAPQLSERVRVVGIGHSDDPWHYEHLCRIGHACDAIVGVSQAITDHLRGLAADFAPRLETIPYGVPLPPPAANAGLGRVSSPGAPLRIIYTGRLVKPQKRSFDLVAIARALDARSVPYEMMIVGDGDLRGTMEREAHDFVRARRLWFTGTQPSAGVMELLATADAFLLPSAFEGLSVGMLEAMSRGVVPVVSDIRSGVPDVIVQGVNGLVAPVGDIGKFTNHLERLWRNPEERARLAAAAAATVAADYGVDAMIDRYIALFRRIVAEPFARPPGPFVPPAHLQAELTWSTWASRIAADPAASVRRVTKRVQQAWR